MTALHCECSGAADPSRFAKTAAPLERSKRNAKREERREQREERLEKREVQERSEKEEIREESRKGLEKYEKRSKTDPEGSKLRSRSSLNHPRRLFGRPRVPLDCCGSGFGRLLGRSRDAPERSWAPLGYLLGCLGVNLMFFLNDVRAPRQCPRIK